MAREKIPNKEQKVTSTNDKSASAPQASVEADPTAKAHPGVPSEAQPKKGFPPTEECDITARKRAEEALRKSEDRFRALIEHSHDAITMLAADGTVLYDSPSISRVLGYGPTERMGKSVFEFVPPEERPSMAHGFARFVQEKGAVTPSEGRFFHKDGTLRYIEGVRTNLLHDPAVRAVVVNYRDITARKQAEEALRETNQQLKSLFDGARDAIFIVDAETGIINDVNNEAALLLNRPKETTIGLHHTKLHPPDKADFHRQRFVERTKVPNPSPVEAEILTSDGRLVPVEISARAIELSKSRRAMVALFRDITDRKRAEEDRLKLEQQTQRTQRLESLGILAGGIAHDFNNLMAIIFGNIDLAIMLGKDQEVSRYLGQAMRSINQARGLTRQLITFSEGGAPFLEIAPLVPLIQETVQFTLSGSNVSGRFDMEEGLWPGKVDKGQISQMLTNIVINAKEAMPAGGEIDVWAKTIVFQEGEHESLPAGDYVRISIRDRGVGILEGNLVKIFDPFYTTKELGRGLGLSVSYSIVKQHGGFIDVESEPGRGSTFHIYLPAWRGQGVAALAQKAAIQRGSGRILVMDDEAAVREMTGKMLKALGCEPVVVRDGREALEVFEKERRAGRFFKALILDLTVRGGMGGREALPAIRKLDESIPVFIASGYAADPVMARPRDHGFTDSLAKPFSMAELGGMLERHLPKKP